ncbi:MAG: ABC transporter permease [Dehalococcoidia bacterium]
MTALLLSELFRLSRRVMPRVLLIVLVLVVLLLYLLIWSFIRLAAQQGGLGAPGADEVGLGSVVPFGLNIVQNVGTILVVILAASMMGTEFGWGTVRTLLPRSAGRAAFLTAKLVTLCLFVALVVLVGFVVALAGGSLVTVVERLDTPLPANFVAHLGGSVLRTMYVMLPYGALAFMLAVLTRGTAAGIGAAMAIRFLEEPILMILALAGDRLAWLPNALLSRNTGALMRLNSPDAGRFDFSPIATLDPWPAAGVLALYTAGFIAIAFWRFQQRDITG